MSIFGEIVPLERVGCCVTMRLCPLLAIGDAAPSLEQYWWVQRSEVGARTDSPSGPLDPRTGYRILPVALELSPGARSGPCRRSTSALRNSANCSARPDALPRSPSRPPP